MVVFGWDASDFDWGRGPMDLGAAARAGISWFTHKATEGTGVRHAHYGDALNRARTAGIPVPGAYHVVRTGDVRAEVAWFLRYLDEATPWWRDHPNFLLQVDLERWPYDNVSGPQGIAFGDALRAATSKVVVVYASRGQYGDGLGGTEPLWNAKYPTSTGGPFQALYHLAGGDSGPGWDPYSGRRPVFWQYSSNATIGSQPGCDANAFRGTLADLLALTSGDDVSAHTDAVIAAWENGLTTAADGTFVAPVDWEVRHEKFEAGAAASLANLAAAVADVKTAVGAPQTVTLSQADRDAIVAGLAGLVPTLEELRGIVDAAVKARLDGATVHTAGT